MSNHICDAGCVKIIKIVRADVSNFNSYLTRFKSSLPPWTPPTENKFVGTRDFLCLTLFCIGNYPLYVTSSRLCHNHIQVKLRAGYASDFHQHRIGLAAWPESRRTFFKALFASLTGFTC